MKWRYMGTGDQGYARCEKPGDYYIQDKSPGYVWGIKADEQWHNITEELGLEPGEVAEKRLQASRDRRFPAPTRKVVQIARGDSNTGVCRLYALCDDGTMWSLSNKWDELPSIPQPK